MQQHRKSEYNNIGKLIKCRDLMSGFVRKVVRHCAKQRETPSLCWTGCRALRCPAWGLIGFNFCSAGNGT